MDFLSKLGDLLSGITGILTLGIALWVWRRALPAELEKFRATRREQREAEVTEAFFSAAETFAGSLYTVLRACDDALLDRLPRSPKYGPGIHQALNRANGNLERFSSAWALMRLYGVGESLSDRVQDLAEKMKEVTDIATCTVDEEELREPSDEHLRKAVMDERVKLSEAVNALLDQTRPIVRHEVPALLNIPRSGRGI